MLKGVSICFYFMLLILTSTAEVDQRGSEGNRKRTVADPVSNLFSELGDLFLDIDRSIAVQSQPIIDKEEALVTRILRPTSKYLNDVQKNYRSLQTRLGTLIRQSVGPKSTYTNRDLSTVSPLNLEGTVSTSKSDYVKDKNLEQKILAESTSESDESDGACTNEILINPFVDSDIREKCYQKLKRNIDADPQIKRSVDRLRRLESKRQSELLIPFDLLDNLQIPLLRRDGVIDSDSKPEGRMIGDVLFSEASFDSNVRQLMKDHGKWVLDNPLLSRLNKVSEDKNKDGSATEIIATESSSSDPTSDDSTQAYSEITTEYVKELLKTDKPQSDTFSARSATYYRITDNDGLVEEDIDLVLRPLSNIETSDNVRNDIQDKLEKETLILAFSPDGVPLKLRMGPEIQNPVRFLHKSLKSAGVSLNVPVESYDDLEPVGKEVMKFGAGILTRAVYFDLSNPNELKSLLKSLMMKSRSGKSNS